MCIRTLFNYFSFICSDLNRIQTGFPPVCFGFLFRYTLGHSDNTTETKFEKKNI